MGPAINRRNYKYSQGHRYSRENVLLLAHDNLSSPSIISDGTQITPAPITQSKQTGRKTTSKSSPPHPTKRRSTQHIQTSSPLPHLSDPGAGNTQLAQAVLSLSRTVKSLETKMSVSKTPSITTKVTPRRATNLYEVSTHPGWREDQHTPLTSTTAQTRGSVTNSG